MSVQTGATSSWADFAAGVHAYRGFLVVEPYQLTVSADARSSVEAARDLAVAPDAPAQVAHMLVYLAFNTMEGATQHLLTLSALLNHDLGPEAVALAIEAEARNCCEASARVAWLLDQAVEPKDRIARGLTASLQSLPLEDARMDTTRQAVHDVATRLNLVVKVNKDGQAVWVGSEPPKSSRLFEMYLGDLFGSDQTARLLWKRWSQVAHVEPFAAFTRPMTANLPGFMVSAATAAAGAHLLANKRTWEYLGRWEDEQFAKRVIGSSAPMMLTLLSITGYGPGRRKRS